MHKRINLNFNWYFCEKFEDSHLTNYANLEGFKSVNLPHTIKETDYNCFNEKDFFISTCYKKDLQIKKEYEGKEINLIFEGVGHKSTIYVNDDFVLIHNGGFDEFKVNITDFVKYGENNIITVVVDSSENPNIPPFGSFIDILCYGGIYKECYLEVCDKEQIKDFRIRTVDVLNSITAYCDITVSYTPVEIVLTVSDDDKTICVNKYNVNREQEVLDFDVKNKINWDIDNPKLYNVNIKMFQEKKLLDEVNGRFGFREIEVKKEGVFLNGKHIKLIGLTRTGSYPYVGISMPQNIERDDAKILKYDLGVNTVRASHIPFSKHFLDCCDEIGLLVIQEIPGWNYYGNREYHKNILDNITSMINRDKNHPSIIMWGSRSSGSVDNYKIYTETHNLCKTLDPTRPTFGAKSVINGEIIEDVYGYNCYDVSNKKPHLTNKKTNTIISEHTGHMYPTKIYDDEAKRLKQALKHLEYINYANKEEQICGVIGHTMTDYNTHYKFGSSDKVSYCGVLDMFRNPKYTLSVYSSLQDDKVVMDLASRMNRGEYENNDLENIYIFTNCEYVKMFKNDQFVETFYPSVSQYPHVKHPPIIVNDFIGQVLERQEKMSHKDSQKIKKIMKKAMNNDYRISLIDRFKSMLILHKYGHNNTYMYELFSKYIIGEVNDDIVYRFDGYLNENVVKSITISDIKKVKLDCEITRTNLIVKNTYDVTKVTVKALDQNDNIIPYCFKPISINVSGGISLIGNSNICLTGGYASFYVKTNQTSNVGHIVITSNDIVIEKDVTIDMLIETK